MNKFNLAVTEEMGFDVDSNKYYVVLKMFKAKREYEVVVQCTNYNIKEWTPQDLTIEFLNESRTSVEKIPYDKDLFQEIEIMACQMFEEMIGEDHQSGAV